MKKTSVNHTVMSLLCSLVRQHGFSFFLEHVAISATKKLPNIHTGLKDSGFKISKEGNLEGKPLFLQHTREPNLRIEVLMDTEVPGHEAFRIVGTLEKYKAVINSLRYNSLYKLLDQQVDTEHIQAEMFRQIETDAVFQIIHRSDESVFFDGD